MKPLQPEIETTETRWGLTDEEFIHKLTNEFKGNKTAFGKVLGVSHTAVQKRVKAIEKTTPKIGGKLATVLLKKSVKPAVKVDIAAAAKEGFSEGVQETTKQLRSLQKLENLLGHIESNLEKVAAPLKDSQRPNTAYIKILVSLVREGRGLITDSFNIKKELFNMKAMATFMEGVLRVMEQYDPHVRTKLYVELSRLGVGEQTHGINEESLSGTEKN